MSTCVTVTLEPLTLSWAWDMVPAASRGPAPVRRNEAIREEETLMKTSVMAGVLAVALGCALASAAAAQSFGGMAGNTSVCTSPDGGQTKVNIHSDGTFVVHLPNGQTTSGNAVDDGKTITFTETSANAGPPVQTPSVQRKVGDTWTVDARGATQNCTLVAGEQ